MVADRRDRQPGDVRGLPGQSLRHSRAPCIPIELAGTMTNPIFSQTIAELTPIPEFIRRAGLGNLPLQLHLADDGPGGAEFPGPARSGLVGIGLFGGAVSRIPPRGRAGRGSREPTAKAKEKADGRSKSARKKADEEAERPKAGTAEPPTPCWRLSPFRLLLFAAFSFLSLQATRNSHQFAAVVGTVTAWNFGEWAAAIRRRRVERSAPEPGRPRPRGRPAWCRGWRPRSPSPR